MNTHSHLNLNHSPTTSTSTARNALPLGSSCINKSQWNAQISCLMTTVSIFVAYLLYQLYALTFHNNPNTHDHGFGSFSAPSSTVTDQPIVSPSSSLSSSSTVFICTAEPFDPWIKPYILPIVGACVGQALTLYFRYFFNFSGDGKLRHPKATRLIIGIASIQALAISCFYLDIIPTTCVDFFGVKTHIFLWFEWLCTVPYLFFLVSIMDVKRQSMHQDDIFIELLGGGSIFLLFITNISILPTSIHWFAIIGANIAMPTALAWQQYNAYYSLKDAEQVVHDIEIAIKAKSPCEQDKNTTNTSSSISAIERDARDALCVARCKWSASQFMSIMFSVIHAIYYINYFNIVDDNVFIILTYFASYLTKVLFTYLITDSHIEILDPNKFLIIEERRKAEESRLNFLRYVFHEVRVPLNSVVLGLQLLQDNRYFAHVERETLTMMKDATNFMSETLNDVLSLQKIEQGMMELDIKPFAPKRLVSAVLSSFRLVF